VIAPLSLHEQSVANLAAELGEILAERYPGVGWDVYHVRDPLVEPPARLAEIVDEARLRLLAEGWDLAVVVTELPLRLNRRPMITHASLTHGVALVSLPAHGVLRVSRRLLASIADAVGALLGDARGARRRLVELAAGAEHAHGIAFVPRVIGGNLRLLLGMVRANRPWRLIARLSRAVVGALAVATAVLIGSDAWRISAALDWPRLTAVASLSIGAALFALVFVHGLWERSSDPAVREQVMLFNITTLVTLAIGVATLYAEAYVLILAGAGLLIDSALLADAIGHPVGVGDYLRLAWLVASLATVGGALGSALESDAAVREAAYASPPTD
jgi:uncharacterized membrane protein